MDDAPGTTVKPKSVPVPRVVVRSIWAMHRALYSGTGGRVGLRAPKPDSYGMLRLRTVGRRSGQERVAILAYVDDGPDLILVAMNGWAEAAPAWWLNLQAHPDASVDLPDGPRAVSARVAMPDERQRLWTLLAEPWGKDRDAYAAGLSHEAPVVILEPRPAA
jgi:deazaflavin-dependent oxidoreductase (nitroreductase family)